MTGAAESSTLQRLYELMDRLLSFVEDAAAILAAVILFGVMVLASLDAIMRYAFDAPIVFQYYLTENYLLIALATLPMAWGFRTGGYIRLEVMRGVLPHRAYISLLRFGLLASAIFVSTLGWMAGGHFLKAYRTNEVHLGVIDWPVAWSWVWVPLGCALLALRLIMIALGPAERVAFRHDVLE